VPKDVKDARFQILYDLHRMIASELNSQYVGTKQVVLVEKVRIQSWTNQYILVVYQDSRRSSECFQGRTDGNIKVNFPKLASLSPGDYCLVDITESSSQSLKGRPVYKTNVLGAPVVEADAMSV